jgi:hypothetical protein
VYPAGGGPNAWQHFTMSLLVVAVGAILAFAVTAEADWIDLGAAGVVLIVIGVAYFVIALLMLGDLWPPGRARRPPPP